jgi:hypothetical protein
LQFRSELGQPSIEAVLTGEEIIVYDFNHPVLSCAEFAIKLSTAMWADVGPQATSPCDGMKSWDVRGILGSEQLPRTLQMLLLLELRFAS